MYQVIILKRFNNSEELYSQPLEVNAKTEDKTRLINGEIVDLIHCYFADKKPAIDFANKY